jgi:peptidyl-tRNA hydrolase, PTH1 family
MAPFRLIVGLGNPGRDYVETRHNVGFMVLDRMATSAGASFRMEKKWQAEVASLRTSAGEVWLCKPQTYMNLSGESVKGHNGLQSVMQHLGTQAVPRIRLGIGSAQPGAATSHVLGKFAAAERSELEAMLSRTAEAIQFAQNQGFAAAMNRYNQNTKDQIL